MLGAKMIASGAMGEMNRSVWSEGSVLGTGKLATSIMGNALRSLLGDITIEITVEGVGPETIILTPSSVEVDVLAQFAALRIRANVLGMVANAIRSHSFSGGNGTLEIWIDL